MFHINHTLGIAGALLAAATLFTACSQNESSSAASDGARTIYGTSQKGPFIKGTKVTLYGMNEKLDQTGEHFSTTIKNNDGNFELKDIPLKDRYAWLSADGYYIDELTGDTSKQKISLNSLVDLQKRDQANINIMTHLSFERTIYLVHHGKSVTKAKKQAEAEVLKAFNMSEEEKSFDQMNILDSSNGDAKLLAISLIMLMAENGGDITQLMSTIALDIEKDGVLNDNENKKIMEKVAHDVIFKTYHIDANITKMGATKIPNYRKYFEEFAMGDSIWIHCDTQDEIQKRNSEDAEYVICRNGK